ncbi:NAD-P-binding protein [Stereum hirsutum FP-91666 SS1]|uniref:NAD-P-binding protein n=1 Tax=Stereum hirsutum (strain FP-91666) TaxID=721885 RepID=UPI000440CE7D|nr:NAD-P-binding protein [Stereum hirsutum FP-91666 SS1]EIM91242.1 NAD-P-binding protein [Stereum hirsutum FP-91666 SS1]
MSSHSAAMSLLTKGAATSTLYKTFAIAGVGNVGKFIAEEFLERKAAGDATQVVILTRKEADNSALAELASRGATIKEVDYDSVDSIAAALSSIDVVICTFGYAAVFQPQFNLAAASKKAGAKLYVPSQFGLPGRAGIPSDDDLKTHLNGVPVSNFLVGTIADILVKYADYGGLVLEKGEVIIPGDGTARISFTDRRDVARYVGYVLTKLPPSKLRGRDFHIEGQRVALNDVIKEYQERSGKTLKVTYIPVEELQSNIEKNAMDILSVIRLLWASGKGVVGEEKEVDNGLFKEWNPKSVVDIALS